jgi:hypothetical protein
VRNRVRNVSQMILDVLVSHGLTPAATHGW